MVLTAQAKMAEDADAGPDGRYRVLLPHSISPGMPKAGARIHHWRGLCMGTHWEVRCVPAADLSPSQEQDLYRQLQAELDAINAEMSHWQGDSALMRYNRAAPGTWHPVSPAFLQVLKFGLQVAQESDGAFDPAAGDLVNLWGFGAQAQAPQTPPSAQQVAACLQQRGQWRQIQIDLAGARILQPGAVVLDFSAIAKGYAVDALAACLHKHHIRHYLLEVGGELRGSGMKPDGMPWWVGLESLPGEISGEMPWLLGLHGLAVATSGDYRRFFIHDGKRYAHTIDPRSGYPCADHDGQVAGVCVVHAECMAADAYATALYVLGAQAGLRFADRHGLCARFLLRGDTKAQPEWREVCSQAWHRMASD